VASLALVFALIGTMIAGLIGFLIFSEIEQAIDCNEINNPNFIKQCESSKGIAWIVIGILPIAVFFALFSVFGGISSVDEPSINSSHDWQNASSIKETKKERQKRKQKELDDQLLAYDDKQVKSFLSNWLRKRK